MGKYSLNPQVMTDIGVTPVATSATAATQQKLGAGHESIVSPKTVTDPFSGGRTTMPADAQAAARPKGCVVTPAAHQRSILQAKGYTPWTDPGTGTMYMCPPQQSGGGGTIDGGLPPEETGGTGLGEFSWPQELQDLYGLLLGRGGELLGSPGFSDQSLSYAFGNDFEKVRQQEAAARQQLLDQQSRSGMLGTGAASKQLSDLAWDTEGGLANIMRDIFLQNESQKRTDINQGGGIFSTGMNFAQALEAINAARRGEGTAAMQQLLALLSLLKG